VLPFPWQVSQTPPDMLRTYFTQRHCKAMLIQVRIEEGPRSKTACVSGLQYYKCS
jgi:hypothetical protein